MTRVVGILLLLAAGMAAAAWPLQPYLAPAGATPAALEGWLTVAPDNAAELERHDDRFDLLADGFRLPPLAVALVSDGGRLLPVPQWPVGNDVSPWELLWMPGWAWRRADGLRGAALPFALLEKEANCLHYGLLRFDLDGDVLQGPLRWQISGETCGYLRFDARGESHEASFQPGRPGGGAARVAAYRSERQSRLPARPVSRLPDDYPQADTAALREPHEAGREHLSTWGFVIDGVHYAGPCPLRNGLHPACEEMPLPSYSLAKSLFAGLAVMRAEKLSPGLQHAEVRTFVRRCDSAAWQGVTVGHALDMATGAYDSTDWNADEDASIAGRFFTAADHATKIAEACGRYPRRDEPGTTWVYHTTDTYVLGTALAEWWGGAPGDLYRELLAAPVWRPLGLSPLADWTRRTGDARRQPYTGWGLVLKPGDLARLAGFLGEERGRLGAEPVFDNTMFEAAMQRRPRDRGLVAGNEALRYNNGFWAWNAADALGCAEPLWIPFMSGYGGIIVALFPNDSAWYYVSDGHRHRWREAARAAHAIRPMCGPAKG